MYRFLITFCLCCSVQALWAGLLMPCMEADTGIFRQTYCAAQLVFINNNLYSPSNPTGIEVIPNGAANGMDSVFRVELLFLAPAEADFVATLCETDTIFINGSAYHTTHFDDVEVFENGAANGCDSILNIKLSFIPEAFSYLNDTICEGNTVEVGGQIFDRATPNGLVRLPAAAYTGCDSLVYVSIFFNKAYVYAGEDQTIFEGGLTCIEAQSAQPVQEISWSPIPAFCQNMPCTRFCTDTLTENIRYTVTIVDINGCTASDDVELRIRRDNAVYGPTVFRPGETAPNDRFFIQADPGITIVRRLLVFDRWGETIFEGKDIPNDDSAYIEGWDGSWRGKDLPPDVFGWWAELETFKGRIITRTGNVTLLR